MTAIALADPTIYVNNVGNATNGEKLRTDLLAIIAELNAKDTAIAAVSTSILTSLKPSTGGAPTIKYVNADTIQLQPCRVVDDSGTYTIDLTSTQNVVINAAAGANSIDTGAEAANTWYYVYLVVNSSTGATAGIISASSTSPTLPAGYDKKYRYSFALRNNASSDIEPFSHIFGRFVFYKTSILVLSGGGATAYTAQGATSAIPPVSQFAYFENTGGSASGVASAYMRETGHTGTGHLAVRCSSTTAGSNAVFCGVNSSQQFDYIVPGGGSGSILDVAVGGYVVTEI